MRKTLAEKVAEVVAKHVGECGEKSRCVKALVHTLLDVDQGDELSTLVAEYAFAARYMPRGCLEPAHAKTLRAREDYDEND